jgi:hypothetical protein
MLRHCSHGQAASRASYTHILPWPDVEATRRGELAVISKRRRPRQDLRLRWGWAGGIEELGAGVRERIEMMRERGRLLFSLPCGAILQVTPMRQVLVGTAGHIFKGFRCRLLICEASWGYFFVSTLLIFILGGDLELQVVMFLEKSYKHG